MIISQSARWLAESAWKAGFKVVTIDHFNDQDTQKYACSSYKLDSFQPDKLIETIKRAWHEHCCDAIVIGSGFEDRPDQIDQIASRWRVLGNTSETIKAGKDPFYFSRILTDNGFRYPLTLSVLSKSPINLHSRFLVKKRAGSGGGHIRWFSPDQTYSEDDYFQQFVEGTNYSVVFVSNGDNVNLIGINQHWTIGEADDKPAHQFLFSGAISCIDFPKALFQEIEKIVSVVSQSLRLVGLCGLDFILDPQDQIIVIEINPRPTATLELHETAEMNLFSMHLEACRGHLKNTRERVKFSRAKMIVYADRARVVSSMDWPNWVVDIPANGQNIFQAEPVCSVIAESTDFDQTREQIKDYHQKIINKVNQWPVSQ